jgi:membrane-associated phospholipid phosphatase
MTATGLLATRSTARRPHLAVAALAVATAAFTVALAGAMDLPLRDPDGIAGPAYIRLPLILAIMFAIDVLPRALRLSRGPRGVVAATRRVVDERWSRQRVGLVLVGLFSFYLTYVAYRNLKSFLPFVREGNADAALLELDQALAFGSQPADLLHDLLGTGLMAHVLSTGYVFFLVFVPISLGVALVWTRDLRRGYFWVTALCVNWVLGALSYYILPSLGPVYVRPEIFADLPFTGVTRLQEQLMSERIEVLASPNATSSVHGIAAFASLHVAIVFSAALVAHLVRAHKVLRWSLWVFFVMTVLATIYFGWHYVIDDVAGVAIGAVAVWLGAKATGHDIRDGLRWRGQLAHQTS